MRILYLTQFFDPEPATIPGLPFASWLQRQGHDVEVVTGFPNYPGGRFYPGHEPDRLSRREVMDGLRVNRVLLYPSHDSSALRRVANYASFALSASTLGTALSRKADACTSTTLPQPSDCLRCCGSTRARSRSCTTCKISGPSPWSSRGWSGARTQAPSSARSRGGVRSSTAARAVRGAVAGIQADPDRAWSAGRQDRSGTELGRRGDLQLASPSYELAQELGMDGRFNIVFAGNMGHFQGLESAIRAVAKLRNLERFQLVFVGSGQAEADLKRLVAELRLENVRFLGRHPLAEMGRITALASALLVSLEDRPFFAALIPSKTQAALACARPLIMAVPAMPPTS